MRLNILNILLLLYGLIFLPQCKDDSPTKDPGNPVDTTATIDSTFTNPLLASGPDPWIIQKDNFYYYTHTFGDRIGLIKTRHVSELSNGTFKTVWNPPSSGEHSKHIWAPELHFIDNKWYIYFAADDGSDVNHRLFVLENSSPDPMVGNWEFKGKIADTEDKWAIDGSVFNYNNQMYFIWSGWRGNNNPGEQEIYISKMINPWTLEGTRVMISKPDHSWEKNGLVNEGPEVLKNNREDIFLIYSASGCWTDNYSLGMMTLKKGGNPLNPTDWSKSPEPLFSTKAANNAYAPGHNGFFKSKDGTEDWIIYHANAQPGQGCGDKRSPRIQKISWTRDSIPVFGEPVKTNVELTKPGGEF